MHIVSICAAYYYYGSTVATVRLGNGTIGVPISCRQDDSNSATPTTLELCRQGIYTDSQTKRGTKPDTTLPVE